MIKTKMAFLEGRLLSSQSEQLKKHSKSSDWLEKRPALQKSHFCFDHVNRLIVTLVIRIFGTLIANVKLTLQKGHFFYGHANLVIVRQRCLRTETLGTVTSNYTGTRFFVLTFWQLFKPDGTKMLNYEILGQNESNY